jgi:hypothetical protein
VELALIFPSVFCQRKECIHSRGKLCIRDMTLISVCVGVCIQGYVCVCVDMCGVCVCGYVWCVWGHHELVLEGYVLVGLLY